MRSTLSHRLPSRSKRWGIRSAWYGDPSSSVALRQCDHHSCLLGRLAIRYRKTNLFGRNGVPKLHWSEECWLRQKLSDVEIRYILAVLWCDFTTYCKGFFISYIHQCQKTMTFATAASPGQLPRCRDISIEFFFSRRCSLVATSQ